MSLCWVGLAVFFGLPGWAMAKTLPASRFQEGCFFVSLVSAIVASALGCAG